MQRRQLFCAYLWHFAVSQYINHTHRCRRAELKQQFVLPVLRRCLRGAGSADSCKMPNLSHTLPNCQHSLAVCLFICFAHGLHDLINTPAKQLQRPLTPVSSHCCPYCQSPLLAFPATLQLRLENFFLSLHTHATRSHTHTRSHTRSHTHTCTLNVLPMLDFDMWPSVDVAALPVSQIPVADESHDATCEGGPLSESRANLICCVKVVLKCDQQQQRQQRLTCPLANFKWNLVNTFKRAKQHLSESTQTRQITSESSAHQN